MTIRQRGQALTHQLRIVIGHNVIFSHPIKKRSKVWIVWRSQEGWQEA